MPVAMNPCIETKSIQVEDLTGHTFLDKRLAVEAVQMAAPQIACVRNNRFEALNNNKRLSILGDAVLAKVLCAAWFDARGPHGQAFSRAQWTELRNSTLSNSALARRGIQIGIDRCILTSAGTPTVSPVMVATTFEAIIGAVYKDGGDDAVERVMEHLGFFEHALLTVTFRPIHFPP
ncbi:ribonuclease III [Decorospora gaudefroyi]|uniref:Ribonuclease III n=1 Tax=Decorospora gaudefroyi TaxID=184978 RepID=A0A6A5KU45_9PLEO|nr:ribonuclease III [Decorospora gaudefroyi]